MKKATALAFTVLVFAITINPNSVAAETVVAQSAGDADAPRQQPPLVAPTSPPQAYACVETDGFITALANSANYACASGKLVKFDRKVAEASGAAQAAREAAEKEKQKAKSPSPSPTPTQAAPATPSPTPTVAPQEQQEAKAPSCPKATPCKRAEPPSAQALVRARANAEAIRGAQKKCGIRADGVLGSQTRECLRKLAETEQQPAKAEEKEPAQVEEQSAKAEEQQETATLVVYWCEHGPEVGGVEWRERPFVCADDTAAELRHLPRGEDCPDDLQLLQVSFTNGRFQACPVTAVAGGTLLEKAPSEGPFYKKWWFWTIVGVAAAATAGAVAWERSKPDVTNDYRSQRQGLGLRF